MKPGAVGAQAIGQAHAQHVGVEGGLGGQVGRQEVDVAELARPKSRQQLWSSGRYRGDGRAPRGRASARSGFPPRRPARSDPARAETPPRQPRDDRPPDPARRCDEARTRCGRDRARRPPAPGSTAHIRNAEAHDRGCARSRSARTARSSGRPPRPRRRLAGTRGRCGGSQSCAPPRARLRPRAWPAPRAGCWPRPRADPLGPTGRPATPPPCWSVDRALRPRPRPRRQAPSAASWRGCPTARCRRARG